MSEESTATENIGDQPNRVKETQTKVKAELKIDENGTFILEALKKFLEENPEVKEQFSVADQEVQKLLKQLDPENLLSDKVKILLASVFFDFDVAKLVNW